MIQQVLSHYSLPLLSCAGLLIFMGVFAAAVLWSGRRSSRALYRNLETLPLRDEDQSATKELQL